VREGVPSLRMGRALTRGMRGLAIRAALGINKACCSTGVRHADGPSPVGVPRTWLATVGWRCAGLIRLDERASARPPPRRAAAAAPLDRAPSGRRAPCTIARA
jgi:hypothetical protein